VSAPVFEVRLRQKTLMASMSPAQVDYPAGSACSINED
jgi:hypothetical protein